MISFCFTHIYTVHLQTICMMFICDSCKARISVGIISKHIKPCTDWKLWDDYSWFSSIPGVKDFKKIPAFIKIEIHKAKIIDQNTPGSDPIKLGNRTMSLIVQKLGWNPLTTNIRIYNFILTPIITVLYAISIVFIIKIIEKMKLSKLLFGRWLW